MMKKLYHLKLSLTILLISFFSFGVFAQSTISGNVTSADTGDPLIGVGVLVKGTTTGAVTDTEGSYRIQAAQGDILVFSYVGMLVQEMTVGTESTINVQLTDDVTTLSDIVITATRQPIRKIQTTTAINTISAEALAVAQPESFAEAIAFVPGVTVQNSQGRKSSYNIRGFPGGNTYVTTLMDGLPLSGFANRSAGTAEFHGIDKGVERIEVVRGSGATLFGRASAAGAVNIITKTGGDKLGGHVSFTNFNSVVGDDHRFNGEFDYRADFNLNGPISEDLRFNVSGYLMEDSGYKEWGQKDKGSQIRGNLDYSINKKSSIRVYGMWGNNQFNNLTDVPYNLRTGELADGWENFNTFYPDNSQLDFNSLLVSSVFSGSPDTLLDVNGNQIMQNQVDANREEVIGGHLGFAGDFDMGDGWSFNYKFRVQRFEWRDQNEITFSSFYTADQNILRLNANSNGQINDLVTEARVQKMIDNGSSTHNISVGIYTSKAAYDRFGGLHWYNSNISPTPTYSWFGPPGTPPPTRFSLSSTTSHQEEEVLSFFAGDEMSFNEKLIINAGLRYDRMTGFYNNDPEEIDGLDYDPATLVENRLEFSDWSWSLGVNYLLAERSAVYASYLRAFSLPSVGLSTPLPEKNEIVTNLELGYRAGFGDLGVDLGLFNTVIDNRSAVVFDPDPSIGQTFVSKLVGTNIVRGAELELTYAPSFVKGLLLRGSFTYQQSEYDDLFVSLDKFNHDGDPTTPTITEVDVDGDLFGLDLIALDAQKDIYAVDVSGNQVHNTPTSIASFNAMYTHEYFGIGFDIVNYAGRKVSSLNIYDTPDLTIANASIFGQYKFGDNTLRVGLRIKNLFDSSSPQQLVLGSTNDSVLVQKQKTPDFNDGTQDILGFGVSQIPRRILFTIGYDF